MKIRASAILGLRYLKELIMPGKREKQLRGAVLGIALSIIPLIVVIVISNGMIQGITNRLIEVFTYHVKISYNPGERVNEALLEEIKAVDQIQQVVIEKKGYSLVKGKKNSSGSTVKAVAQDQVLKDPKFLRNFSLKEGQFSLSPIPPIVEKELFLSKILPRVRNSGDRSMLSASYEETGGLFKLREDVSSDNIERLKAVWKKLKYSSVLVGDALAKYKLDVKVGDQIFLLSVKTKGGRSIPRSSKFIVSGIFSTGYQDIDKYLLYINLESGNKILPPENSEQFIGIKVADPFKELRPLKDTLKNLLYEKGFRYTRVETWSEAQRNQYESFKTTRTLLILIMGFIVLVAAVNVSSAIVMLVMGKTREIAILKSMGARPSTISFSFLITGFFTGVAGTLCGLVPGLFIAVNINEFLSIIEKIVNGVSAGLYKIVSFVYTVEKTEGFKILNPEYYLENIPIQVTLEEVMGVACFSIVVTTLAAWVPANKAGRVKPLEIIRRY